MQQRHRWLDYDERLKSALFFTFQIYVCNHICILIVKSYLSVVSRENTKVETISDLTVRLMSCCYGPAYCGMIVPVL